MNSENLLKYICHFTFCCVIIAAGIMLLMAQSGKIIGKDQKTAEAITAARKALGGEKNIDNIKSLILTGSRRHLKSGQRIEIEIRILFPDSFLQITKRDSFGNYIAYRGVSKGKLLQETFEDEKKILTSQENLNSVINWFTCLLMGAVLKNEPDAPMSLTSVSDASNRFSLANARGALGEIEFDSDSKYPVSISFKDIVGKISSQISVGPKANSQIISFPTEYNTVDTIMRFKDRAAVDGIMFPRAIVLERLDNRDADFEFKFDKIQINPKLTLADFEISQSR